MSRSQTRNFLKEYSVAFSNPSRAVFNRDDIERSFPGESPEELSRAIIHAMEDAERACIRSGSHVACLMLNGKQFDVNHLGFLNEEFGRVRTDNFNRRMIERGYIPDCYVGPLPPPPPHTFVRDQLDFPGEKEPDTIEDYIKILTEFAT